MLRVVAGANGRHSFLCLSLRHPWSYVPYYVRSSALANFVEFDYSNFCRLVTLAKCCQHVQTFGFPRLHGGTLFVYVRYIILYMYDYVIPYITRVY